MKRLSTVLLTSTLALSMITPVVATGVEGAKVEPTTKIEEVAKEAAKKVEEEVKEVKEEVKEVASEKLAVKVSPQKVTLDGKEIKISGYNIKGENYFKLRDLAAVFKDTDAKFSVDYKAAEEVKEVEEETEAKEEAAEVKEEVKEAVAEGIKGEKEEAKLTKPMILLETGKEYEVLDTDLKEVKAEATATKTKDEVKVNGEDLEAKAFKIDGNNYYRLRDLGAVLNFGVDYDKETNTVVLTSKVEEKAEVKEEAKEEVKEEKTEAKEEVKEEKAEVKEEVKKEEAAK